MSTWRPRKLTFYSLGLAGCLILGLVLDVCAEGQPAQQVALKEPAENTLPAAVGGLPMNQSLSAEHQRLIEKEAQLLAELKTARADKHSVNDDKPGAASSKAEALSAVVAGPLPAKTANTARDVAAATSAPQPEDSSAAIGKSVVLKTPARKDAEQKKLIESLQSSSFKLAGDLKQADQRINALQQELEETRNRLILAETEVERLTTRLNVRNRTSLNAMVGEKAAAAAVPLPAKAAPRVIAPSADESEIQVATVVADKAALRAGPGDQNSPLMEVTRGTRLTVETRQGKWYRVNSPNGTRAWISGDVVEFGERAVKPGSSLGRVKSYDESADEEAFRLFKSGVK